MGSPSPISRIAIWGLGRVGTGFALALSDLPISLYLFSTSEASRERASNLGLEVEASQDSWAQKAQEADIIAFAWSDDAISKAIRTCTFEPRSTQLLVHFSGLLNADDLGETAALKASLHPLAACPTPRAAEMVFKNGPLVLEGSKDALARLEPLTQSLGADIHYLREGQKAPYHAGAVLGSNALIGLLHAALEEWNRAGLHNGEQLILSLAQSALDGAQTHGLRDGLTGPLKRADQGSIEKHLNTLESDRLSLYKILNRELIQLLGEGHFNQKTILKLQELLKED